MILTSRSGWISSPGYDDGQPYPNNITCTWAIDENSDNEVNTQLTNSCLFIDPISGPVFTKCDSNHNHDSDSKLAI